MLYNTQNNLCYYSFTAKIVTKKKPLTSDYEDWLIYVNNKQNFNICTFAFEIDTLDRLHVHGIALARNRYFAPQLSRYGVHTHIKQMESHHDLIRYNDYISMEQSEPYQQKLFAYEVRHSDYPFV